MSKYRVTFEVCKSNAHKDIRSVVVEATSKTNAYGKGIHEMSKIEEFQNMFKKIISVEEEK